MRPIHLAAAAAALLAPGIAQAQDRAPCGAGMVCASDPATVLHALEKAGLKPVQATDNQGDPVIFSDAAAYPFDVYFYGCEQHRHCDSLRFQVTFRKGAENTAALANTWNVANRFLQAAATPDGRLVVAYDLGTIGGINQRNFADAIDWWQSMLEELGDFFQKQLDLKPKG
jgi:hypothetical protein